MVSQAAVSLRDTLEGKLEELGEALEGLDETKATERPGDAEWCCKEVLSHLLGEEGDDLVTGLRRFLDEDTPLIGLVTGLPYYTPERQKMSLSELRAGVWKRYQGVADFVGDLSEEQLARKARVPLLKDTPLGEHPTLAQWVGVLINLHLPDHINQVRSARERVGA